MLQGKISRVLRARTDREPKVTAHPAWMPARSPGISSGNSPGSSSGGRLEASFIAFVALWMFVGLVSAYDGYLTVRHKHLLHILEVNPVGRWIMDLDSGLELGDGFEYVVANRQLANFLGLKFAGTVLGLGIMLVVHQYKASMGLLVTGVIAGLQGILAVYLSFF